MQAVILAGDLGTRLEEIPQDTSRFMTLIGDKPLLEHQINLLRHFGIENIVLIVNHLKDAIQIHFGDGAHLGVAISYYEEKALLGTASGIKACEDLLENDFIVLHGDVMVDMNLLRLVEFHYQSKSDCTLVLHPNDHPSESDLIELDKNNKIVAFHPKQRRNDRYYRNMVNAGLYVMSKKVLSYVERKKEADFERDVFPTVIKKLNVRGYLTSEYLKEMGAPDRLEQVRKDFAADKIQKRNLINMQKAIFLDRDGVINVDVDLVAYPDELEVYPFAPAAIRKINESDYLTIVITNQSVVARNLCTEDELRVIHNKLDTVIVAEHAKLDALYYCPHHPHGGFPEENPTYKIDCHCRKPKPGMLLDAARDFNIDLSQSWFIGDNERDVVAGKAAGVKTIGVRTGHALKGSTVQPDFVVDNLKEAVDFILGLK